MKRRVEVLSYLLGVLGFGFGTILAILAYFAIVGALAATVAGIIVAVGLLYISTLDYFCGSRYWLGIAFGGFTGGCNPVPWYL